MNSMSNNCHHNDTDRKEKCCPTVIKCNRNPNTISVVSGTSPTQVASVDINTHHIDNPCTIVEFSVNAATTATTVGTISLQVYKAPCMNLSNTTAVGAPYIYGPAAANTSAPTNTISFSVCDCSQCTNNNCNCNCNCNSCYNDCYVYTVVVTSSVTASSITLTNATIGLISSCGTSNCCCQC